MARILIIIGAVLLVAGLIIQFAPPRWWQWFGRLPGDIRVEKENVRIYFPWVSMLLISLIISLVLTIFRRFRF